MEGAEVVRRRAGEAELCGRESVEDEVAGALATGVVVREGFLTEADPEVEAGRGAGVEATGRVRGVER